MDFFQQQDRARRKTKWLVLYFAVAVALMILAVYLAVILIFKGVHAHQHHRYDYDEPAPVSSFWDASMFIGVSVVTLAIIGFGSLYKTMALSAGGSVVSTMMGGRLVSPDTREPDERKLINVVEEMAIASGIAVPQVYVIDAENGINAFAAGHTTADATVTVTRGCMRLLSRDELQGVIGHEFSHILNGDMRLNLRLMGTIFGILCLAVIGRILLRTGGSSNNRGRGQNPLPLLGLALLVIGYIGVFFGRLIQAAVSRQREFLADASSVQFTRNPAGITGALKKIGGLGEMGSRLDTARAMEVSHMFFGNGVNEPFIELLETHPPLAARIRAIDPSFDGNFPYVRYDDTDRTPLDAPRPKTVPPPIPKEWSTVIGAAILASAGQKPPPTPPQSVVSNVGNPTPSHLQYAERLRESLPDDIRSAARDPWGAVALVYAMLLSCDDDDRAKQLDELSTRIDPSVRQKTIDLYPAVSKAAAPAHLPLINLALGSLKQLTAGEYEKFSQTLDWLVRHDGKVELFEFVLQKIICHHLAPKFEKTTRPIIQYYSIKSVVPDCAVLLSALANVSTDDLQGAQMAFNHAVPWLRAPDDPALRLCGPGDCGVDRLDVALNRLAQAAPLIKKNLIEACSHVVTADDKILESEAELLRAIADTLDCPIPPFVTTE